MGWNLLARLQNGGIHGLKNKKLMKNYFTGGLFPDQDPALDPYPSLFKMPTKNKFLFQADLL
jgi:hypothetical protein